jgi:hypothetical protein
VYGKASAVGEETRRGSALIEPRSTEPIHRGSEHGMQRR